MEKNISDIIKRIDDFVEILYCNYNDAIKEIANIVTLIEPYMVKFIENVDYYNKYGENIDKNILIQQLQNLLDGINYSDQIEIADSLKYEIKESLLVYSELVQIYGK